MRLLLSGYYGLGNLGDEAILAGLAGALTAQGHEVTVLSGDPDATERQHGVRAAHRYRGLPGSLLRTDALISGGGGLLQDVTSARSLGYYLATIRLARILGKRVVVYGQSLGPLSGEGRTRVTRALRGVPAFWRDEPSLALARELGIDDRATADAALLLAPDEPITPDPAGAVLLVPRAGHPAYNNALRRLAGSLRAGGRPVAVGALHAGQDDAEVEALARSAPGLKVVVTRTPAELLAALPRMSCVVSARLHGCILAAAVGVPFAALSYDPKVEGFAKQTGAPVFHAPVDERRLLDAVAGLTAFDQVRRERLVASAEDGVRALGLVLQDRRDRPR